MQHHKSTEHIWHPFTQMKKAPEPVHIVKAKDCTLYDKDGNTYIDAISSWWVNIHGHCREEIAEAIGKQAKELAHIIFAGFTHTPAIRLAENIIGLLPEPFSKVFFSDNGSTSVEVALKMAMQYRHNEGMTHKRKIIAFENSYHGDTFGSMSVAARNAFNAPFEDFLFEVIHLPLPDAKNRDTIIKQFTELTDTGEVSIFIFEPLVQGAAGMHMYAAADLDELISIARRNDVLCIADEVMTGFGRTGKIFAIDHLSNKPDIICLSKGITGGFMPLGLTACTQRIYDAFYSDDAHKTFFHGHSYTANPLACAAANASIALLKEDDCNKQIQQISEKLKEYAGNLARHPLVKNMRQLGTILAFEVATAENDDYFNSLHYRLQDFFKRQGVFLRPLGNTVYVMPPYCITKTELKKVFEAIEEAIEVVLSGKC